MRKIQNANRLIGIFYNKVLNPVLEKKEPICRSWFFPFEVAAALVFFCFSPVAVVSCSCFNCFCSALQPPTGFFHATASLCLLLRLLLIFSASFTPSTSSDSNWFYSFFLRLLSCFWFCTCRCLLSFQQLNNCFFPCAALAAAASVLCCSFFP
ncbi:hypothetical protein M9H77_20917 [Catharanthus roseus]|uniref:Uncharacterized protein n=1 Tax=Catharanthus roseus TaxID=4058 RepID=A0ACC0ALZ6_CATRO|nr:hypothetical protein M9H77_20917 [Catharanthus roseus]